MYFTFESSPTSCWLCEGVYDALRGMREWCVQAVIFQPQNLMGAGSMSVGAAAPAGGAVPAVAAMPPPPPARPPQLPSQATPSNLSLDHLLMLANLTNSAADWTTPALNSAGMPCHVLHPGPMDYCIY